MREDEIQTGRGRGEAGFALLLALLSLMLLTFLGLTLATTTTTELQIATNYRWGQQALYNAEAGVEAGKSLLRNMNWAVILPSPRRAASAGCTPTTPGMQCWVDTGSGPPPVAAPLPPYTRPDKGGHPSRNFENGNCDRRGSGVGFGVVLDDGGGEAPYQNVTNVFGQNLEGAFTVWVRRDLEPNQDGSYSDRSDLDVLVLTAEGTAPYTRGTLGETLAQANRAARVLEVSLSRTTGVPCGTRGGQVGGGPEGSNFSPCDPITGDSLTGALGGARTENTGVQ